MPVFRIATVTLSVVYVIGLAIHAHMLFEVYKLRRDIIKGTNVRGV